MTAPRRDNAERELGEVGTANKTQRNYSTSGGIDNLLSKLDKVRRTGNGTYLAACPSHDDRSPSLTIRELDDGRILLHDFGGCDVQDVLASIGLTFADLYPPRQIEHGKPERRPFPAADVLRAISFEALVVASAGVSILAGNFTGGDRERLIIAVHPIQSALTAAGVAL